MGRLFTQQSVTGFFILQIMANRFLETNYYKSPFVRSLKGSLKGLYSFIICDCTPSGIWVLDIDIASMYIGFKITFDEFEENFIKTGKAIDLQNGRYFFPDFIEHQYPKGLSDTNIALKNVIPELRKLGLIDASNKVIKDPSKTLQRGKGIGIGEGIGKGSLKQQHNSFNTKPIISDFNGLPRQYIDNSKELVFRLNNKLKIDDADVIALWEVFKVQHLTGENWYANEGKVYSHFINVIKKEKFNNGTGNSKGSAKLGPSEGRAIANRDY